MDGFRPNEAVFVFLDAVVLGLVVGFFCPTFCQKCEIANSAFGRGASSYCLLYHP